MSIASALAVTAVGMVAAASPSVADTDTSGWVAVSNVLRHDQLLTSADTKHEGASDITKTYDGNTGSFWSTWGATTGTVTGTYNFSHDYEAHQISIAWNEATPVKYTVQYKDSTGAWANTSIVDQVPHAITSTATDYEEVVPFDSVVTSGLQVVYTFDGTTSTAGGATPHGYMKVREIEVAGKSEPDTVAPSVSATTSTAANDQGWFTSATTLTLTGADNVTAPTDVVRRYKLNGAADWTTYTAPITLPEGTTTVVAKAVDAAGNESAETTFGPYKVDLTDPVANVSVTDRKLSAAPTDANGIATLEYKIGTNDWVAAPGTSFSGVALGDLRVAYQVRVTDGAGRVLTTAPVTIPSLNNPTLSSVVVSAPPAKTLYLPGEAFDASGLTLKAIYDDGLEENVTTGFVVSAVDTSTRGTKTATVSYTDPNHSGVTKTTQFDVLVLPAGSTPVANVLSDDHKLTSEASKAESGTLVNGILKSTYDGIKTNNGWSTYPGTTNPVTATYTFSHQYVINNVHIWSWEKAAKSYTVQYLDDSGTWQNTSVVNQPVPATPTTNNYEAAIRPVIASGVRVVLTMDGSSYTKISEIEIAGMALPDETAPAVSVTTSSPASDGGWYTSSPLTVTLTGDDAVSLPASTPVEYEVVAGEYSPSHTPVYAPYTTPLSLTEGTWTLYAKATDEAGNVGTLHRTFQIDATLPTVSQSITGRVLTVTANDNLPGYVVEYQYYNEHLGHAKDVWREYTGPVTLPDYRVTVQAHVVDVAGNVVSTDELVLPSKVAPDLESLEITSAADTNVYTVGDSFDASGLEVTAVYTDGLEQDVTGTVHNDFDSATVGAKVVTLSYTAGAVTKTVSYEVAVMTGSEVAADNIFRVSGESVSVAAGATESGYSADKTIDGNLANGKDSAWSDYPGTAARTEDSLTYTLSRDYIVNQVRVYVSESKPNAITVQYRDADGVWRSTSAAPLTNVATSTTAPNTISFDPVITSALRVVFDVSGSKYLKASEVEATGTRIPASPIADLSDLQVDGTTVTGFSKTTLSYGPLALSSEQGAGIPQITATAAERHASVAVTQATAATLLATVKVTAQDGTVKTYTVSFADETAPVATFTSKPEAPAESGYYVGTTKVTIVGTDNAGVVKREYRLDAGTDEAGWLEYKSPVTLPDGDVTFYARVWDGAGHVSAVISQSFRVDATRPVVTISVSDPGRVLTLTASDANGIKPGTLQYKLPDGDWTAYTKPVQLSDDAQTVQARATDNPGNDQTAVLAVLAKPAPEPPVDTDDPTPPVVVPTHPGGGKTTYTRKVAPPKIVVKSKPKDLKQAKGSKATVTWLWQTGIAQGKAPKGKYHPKANLKRGELASMLYRLAGSPDRGKLSYSKLKDVKKGSAHAADIAWAQKNGLLTSSKGKFKPKGTITRAQLAKVLRKFVKYAGFSVTKGRTAPVTFKDVKGSKSAISWVVDAGVMTGTSAKKFSPKKKVTKAQVSVFIYNVYTRFLQ